MKRAFDEISDDEWGDAAVNLDRATERPVHENHISNGNSLKKEVKFLPPRESVAFKTKSKGIISTPQRSDHPLEDDDFQVTKGSQGRPFVVDESDEEVEPIVARGNGSQGRPFVVDESDKEFEPTVARGNGSQGRPFVVDESDEDFESIVEKERNVVALLSDESESLGTGLQHAKVDVEDMVEIDPNLEEEHAEDDVIANALQKCDQIAVILREDLHASAARIVTQGDVDAAYNYESSEFQPILKPHQLEGVNFLLLLHHKGIGGAILADEMGLGKTVQVIIFLSLLKHLDKDPGPHLVVCPASVLEIWEEEFAKWCPSFTVIKFHGAGRAGLSKTLNFLAKTGAPSPYNVVLVCYTLFERNSAQQKDDREVLTKWRWSCVIMDEAHCLKDRSSNRSTNLMAVAQNAKQRLMLTGTPLQNNLKELWSLLEFMMPNIFETGDVEMKKVLSASAEDTNLIARIKTILGPFILRRLKSDVMQELLQKTHKIESLTMVPEQAAAYKEAIEEYRGASLARLAENAGPAVENYFTQFRKIANHPLLVRRIYTETDVHNLAEILHARGAFGDQCTLERVREEMLGYNDFLLHQSSLSYGGVGCRGTLDDRHALCSAKCQALSKLLPVLHREGHRALIFSQWTKMLDILEWALFTIGMTYIRLDGSTDVSERKTIVDTFNNDPTIFACLLSTRAGGQGINLTGADTVIIHDMDFNPQRDRQAEDRCHRIGQKKPVTVYRLVTKGTVDENIFTIAKRKLFLDAAVLESREEEVNDNDRDARTIRDILAAILASTPS